MGTVGLIILFVAVALIDIRQVWRNKEKKEILLYFSILILAFGLSELHILGFRLIGLNHIVESLFNF
nr:hypothetical protein [Neobacillus sp. Marseille-Q6967]